MIVSKKTRDLTLDPEPSFTKKSGPLTKKKKVLETMLIPKVTLPLPKKVVSSTAMDNAESVPR